MRREAWCLCALLSVVGCGYRTPPARTEASGWGAPAQSRTFEGSGGGRRSSSSAEVHDIRLSDGTAVVFAELTQGALSVFLGSAPAMAPRSATTSRQTWASNQRTAPPSRQNSGTTIASTTTTTVIDCVFARLVAPSRPCASSTGKLSRLASGRS